MRSAIFLDGDLTQILAAIYAARVDDPSPYGAGFRRGIETVALALGLPTGTLDLYLPAEQPRARVVQAHWPALGIMGQTPKEE